MPYKIIRHNSLDGTAAPIRKNGDVALFPLERVQELTSKWNAEGRQYNSAIWYDYESDGAIIDPAFDGE